jgi:hypothetical protein
MYSQLKIVLALTSILIVSVNSRDFNPKTAVDFHKAIERAGPGDTIQLEAIDYKGDFIMDQSGDKNRPIKILGYVKFF